MRYLPHTSEDIAEMLAVTGKSSLDELFADAIPEDCRFDGELNLPKMTEWQLNAHASALAGKNASASNCKVFVGAGSYSHYIPHTIPFLSSRSELYTAYTPYQPEISQGTLQAIFEYQTLTARLLGMELANASMYDGASALAEALLMAIRISRGKKTTVAVSKLVHPMYRKVVETYLHPAGFKIVELPYLPDGSTDLSPLNGIDNLAGVALQSPNFWGCVEDVQAFSDKVKGLKAVSIVGFTEPMAYALFKNPGEQGAEIVCGEGQSMGIPQSFGGPGLGMFASLDKYARNMPGRLIGKTTDIDGKPGYVLTLATREQHIRREKATSNICSNQGLCATMSAMYMASVGGTGIRHLARLNRDKAEYMKAELKKAGVEIPFGRPSFNEFVAKFPDGFDAKYQKLLKENIMAGIPLDCYYPELKNHYLLCATETHSKADIDEMVKEVTA